MLDDQARCRELASPNLPNLVVSCLILFGILVSYLPQHHRIISRRSSEGLSPYFILLGTISGTCGIANILVLPTSRTDIKCCKVNSPFACAAGLLGIAQVGAQWSCFFLIMFLFLIFAPQRVPLDTAADAPISDSLGPGRRAAVIIFSISIFQLVATFLISVLFLARFPSYLQLWADILGLLCAVFASIQYLPQIWTTWKLQHVGSLSIPMMCIQTPGGFVFAASMAARLGKKNWSAWAVYLVLGTLQGCLLAMAVWFEIRDRRNKQKQTLHGELREDSPLLGEIRRNGARAQLQSNAT